MVMHDCSVCAWWLFGDSSFFEFVCVGSICVYEIKTISTICFSKKNYKSKFRISKERIVVRVISTICFSKIF